MWSVVMATPAETIATGEPKKLTRRGLEVSAEPDLDHSLPLDVILLVQRERIKE